MLSALFTGVFYKQALTIHIWMELFNHCAALQSKRALKQILKQNGFLIWTELVTQLIKCFSLCKYKAQQVWTALKLLENHSIARSSVIRFLSSAKCAPYATLTYSQVISMEIMNSHFSFYRNFSIRRLLCNTIFGRFTRDLHCMIFWYRLTRTTPTRTDSWN